MLEKRDFPKWLQKHGLAYEPASAEDFRAGAELLIVDLRRPLDPCVSLCAQASIIRIEEILGEMVYYRYHPDGKEECFVPMRSFLVHETSVVLKRRVLAEVVRLKTAS